jgi:hypothetical protein
VWRRPHPRRNRIGKMERYQHGRAIRTGIGLGVRLVVVV